MKPALRSPIFGDSLATARPLRPDECEQETGGTSPIPSSILAVAIFIASELMLFGGLLSALPSLYRRESEWPAAGRAPSASPDYDAQHPHPVRQQLDGHPRGQGRTKWRARRARQSASVYVAAGAVFLLIQGSEWVRLIHFGLTLSSQCLRRPLLHVGWNTCATRDRWRWWRYACC